MERITTNNISDLQPGTTIYQYPLSGNTKVFFNLFDKKNIKKYEVINVLKLTEQVEVKNKTYKTINFDHLISGYYWMK